MRTELAPGDADIAMDLAAEFRELMTSVVWGIEERRLEILRSVEDSGEGRRVVCCRSPSERQLKSLDRWSL